MTLLALAMLAAAQDALQKPVTFEARASRASVLIPQLAKAAGLQMEVNPQIANEVILVSAKDVPLKTLMDKIASVTSGEWRADGEIYRLQPSNVARNRESSEEAALRLTTARKAVAELVKRVDSQKGTPGEAGNPDERAIALLLRGVDVTPIAALNGGERLVFATSPTAMQRPLPANAGQVVAQLVTQHNAQIAKMPQMEGMAEMEKMPDFVKEMMKQRTKKIENAQKALLVISKPSIGIVSMTQCELRIYDGQGKIAYTANSMLGNSMMEVAAMMNPANPAKPAKPGKQTPITYSEDSKAMLGGMQGATFGGAEFKLDPKLLDRLHRPDLYDPLSYMATDEFLSLSKQKGKALVANVPDAMMGSINTLVPGGKQTVEDFEADLQKGETVSYSETEGWIVAKPAKPTESRANRTDRAALATLIAASLKKGIPSLDDVAAYSLTSPSPMEDGVGMLFAMVLVPGMIQQGLEGMTNWDALRFYGTLSTTQKATALRGGTFAMGQLGPQQQGLWRKLAFGANSRIRLASDKAEDMPFAFALAMMTGGTGDFRQEPTELLPNGIPGQAQLTFNVTTQPIASPAGNTIGFMGVLGPDELAIMKMFKEDPNMAAVAGFMPSMEKLKIGERSVISMTVQLPQEAYLKETLHDNRMPANAPVASLANLPEGFQKLIAERLELIKKSPFGSIGALMGGMGRGPIKP